MQIEFEQLVSLSESWLPVLLEYGGKLALALLTLALGWWLINRLSLRLQRLMGGRKVDRALRCWVSFFPHPNDRGLVPAGLALRTDL